VVNSAKISIQIQQDEFRGFASCSCQFQSFNSRVSVKWPLLKPDWLLSRVLLCKKGRDLFENDLFKCISNEWKKVFNFVDELWGWYQCEDRCW